MASTESNGNGNGSGNTAPKKQLLLNAFLMNTPGHLSPGLWRHPRNETANYHKLSFWTSLAQKLDAGGFHAMFIADTLGPYDVYKGPANVDPALAAGAQYPVNDPLYTVPPMAAATKNLVFGVTASTTYDAPYALARRLSTVDHLAEGRVAWNIVTSYLESAAKNFGLETQIEHDERYRIANEYMDVVYKVNKIHLQLVICKELTVNILFFKSVMGRQLARRRRHPRQADRAIRSPWAGAPDQP